MVQQIPVDHSASALHPQEDDGRHDGTREVAGDVAYRRLGIVNVAFVGRPGAGDRGWVLIDTGVAGTRHWITDAAERRFGASARPSAIVLTHGHFDHVGALPWLAEHWDVPVYAHRLERPYLTGKASYPPGDPAVGGGLMARMARLYPRGPIDLGARFKPLPEDGSVPPLPGWRWLHTPGHSVGHVSLWRDADRTLLAGDAVVTTAQESASAVALQSPEMHGPPRYFTIDWEASRESVRALAALEPALLVTGHGEAMQGPAMTQALSRLAAEFDRVARPKAGRYVQRPEHAEDGAAYHAA